MVGVAVGVASSIALTRVMQTLLFDVSTTDVRVFAGVSALFIAVAVMSDSCRRGARSHQPITALRA